MTTEVPIIEVAFRRIFDSHPEFSVGDVIQTTFDKAVQIVDKKSGEEHRLDGFVYVVETSEKKRKLVHESAILGRADDAEAISDERSSVS